MRINVDGMQRLETTNLPAPVAGKYAPAQAEDVAESTSSSQATEVVTNTDKYIDLARNAPETRDDAMEDAKNKLNSGELLSQKSIANAANNMLKYGI